MWHNQFIKLKTKRRIFILTSLIVFGLAGCNNAGNSTTNTTPPNTSDTKLKPASIEGEYLMQMGSGFDTSSDTVNSSSPCLIGANNPDNIFIGNPEAMITLDQEQGISELQKALDVDVSSKFGGGRFGVSLAAQFANNSKDNAYTTNLIYLYKYAGHAAFKNGSLNQGDNALTDTALQYVHSDQTLFRTTCGNRYISELDAGLVLAVKLSLSFNSHLDQQKFNTKLKGSYGLVDISAAIQTAATDSNVHANFSLAALQLGGQPQKLNDLFGEKGQDGHYPFINCTSVGNPNKDSCKSMIDAIVNYAQSLSDQVSNKDGSLILDRLYYSQPRLSDYSSLGIVVGAKDPGPDVLKAMQDLTTQYDKAVTDYVFVTHYTDTLKNKLDSILQTELTEAGKRLAKQINNVYLASIYKVHNCYQGYVSDQCITIKANVDSALKDYALEPAQSSLIKYLETSSYSANLYSYVGGAVEKEEDYAMYPDVCILTPISLPYMEKYAVYCDGDWLKTTGVLTLRNKANDGITINGLKYTSTYINPADLQVYSQIIDYPDLEVMSNSTYPILFYNRETHVVGGKTFETYKAEFMLTRLYENPV